MLCQNFWLNWVEETISSILGLYSLRRHRIRFMMGTPYVRRNCSEQTLTANLIGPTLAQRGSWRLHVGPTWAQYVLLSGEAQATSVMITLEVSPTLQWRHNGRDSVSNHQPHDCLLNRLFRRKSKKTSKLRVTGLCAGNSSGTGIHRGPVNSPYKWPVTRKMFPFDDVIMKHDSGQ